jgi:hypothetical protein
MSMTDYRLAVCLLALAASLAAPPNTSAQAPAAPAPASTNQPDTVAARIKVAEKGWLDVELVRRQADKVFYREKGGPKEASLGINMDGILATEFVFKFEERDLNRAMIERNWNAANAILWSPVNSILSYVDLKDNNGADFALQLGTTLIKAATVIRRTKGGDLEKAKKFNTEAYRILMAVAKANWYPAARTARLRAVQCLILLGDLQGADKELKDAPNPEPGDAAYGLYWLMQAELHMARNEIRPAMDAVVKSLVFENKDVETFPDALLLSGRCYEELLEYYRARDVNYEVAKLFQQTDWGTTGKERLQAIMDKGATKAKETIDIDKVFFNTEEDMNAKANALLKGEETEDQIGTPAEQEKAITEEMIPDEPKKVDPNAPPVDEPPPSAEKTPAADKPPVVPPIINKQEPAADKPAAPAPTVKDDKGKKDTATAPKPKGDKKK